MRQVLCFYMLIRRFSVNESIYLVAFSANCLLGPYSNPHSLCARSLLRPFIQP